MDLGVFNSMQARTNRRNKDQRGIEGIIDMVDQTFQEYDSNTLQVLFAHLYGCYNEILRMEGGNQYDSPHEGAREKVTRGEAYNSVAIDQGEFNRLRKLVRDFDRDNA